jgi:hypothetical protein
MERDNSLSTPLAGGDLRCSFALNRSHSGHYNSAPPMPSPRQHCTSRSCQVADLTGASASGMQSQQQTHDHKIALAYMRPTSNSFKTNDSISSGRMKNPPTILPLMRGWAVHSAYRSEFAQEIEAQQTPRYRSQNHHSGQSFGIASTSRPVHTRPATPRNRTIQVHIVTISCLLLLQAASHCTCLVVLVIDNTVMTNLNPTKHEAYCLALVIKE